MISYMIFYIVFSYMYMLPITVKLRTRHRNMYLLLVLAPIGLPFYLGAALIELQEGS